MPFVHPDFVFEFFRRVFYDDDDDEGDVISWCNSGVPIYCLKSDHFFHYYHHTIPVC